MCPRKAILFFAFIVCAIAADLSFDVASIRRPERDEMIAMELDILNMLKTGSRAPAANSKPIVHGQHVDMNLVSVRDLVASAYGITSALIDGPPSLDGRWVIHARTPAGTTPGQIPEMLRSLLHERFHFSAHYDTIQSKAWALVTIKGSSKLNPARKLDRSTCNPWVPDYRDGETEVCSMTQTEEKKTISITAMTDSEYGPWESRLENNRYRTEFFGISTGQLALYLTSKLSTNNYSRKGEEVLVIDRSAIEGAWDLVLDNVATDPETVSVALQDGDSPFGSYQTALEHIGLRLNHTNAPVKRLVVDHVDTLPVEN
jgi:uncharacterized protein (TIGR03435 family)